MTDNELIAQTTCKFPTIERWGTVSITGLTGIKIGDVFMRNDQGRWDNCTNYKKVVCEKITPKQAVIGGIKYWIEKASLVGGYGGDLMPVNEKKIEESRLERQIYSIRNKLRETDWRYIEDEIVLAVYALIKKPNATEGSVK